MYFVKYGNAYLHDPRVSEYILLDLTLDYEENSCGYCDFTIYPNHPLYDKLKIRDADNPVQVYDGDILLFSGFIYELGKEFYLDGHVKCKGELDYLAESIVRPYSTITRGYGNKAPYTVNGYFEWLITQHNNQVEANRRFVIGTNEGDIIDTNNYIFRESDSYPTTIDELSDKLLKELGGYIRVRHENGVRYIDYLAEWTELNTQVLDFGVNLTDYSQTDDSADMATYVIPLGARMADTEYEYDDGYSQTEDNVVDIRKTYYTKSYGYVRCEDMAAFEDGVTYYECDENTNEYSETSDTTPDSNTRYYTYEFTGYSGHDDLISFVYEKASISEFESGVTYYEYNSSTKAFSQTSDTEYTSGKTYYTATGSSTNYYEYDENEDESDNLLTISSLANGNCEVDGYKKKDDIIYHESYAFQYGYVGMTYENTDVTTKEELLLRGLVALRSRVSPGRTIEVRAIDMHFINPDAKPIRVGEYVQVRSSPHNLDSFFLCSSIDLDLNNPENSVYTLGSTYDILTGQHNRMIDSLNNTDRKTYESVSPISAELKLNAIQKGE